MPRASSSMWEKYSPKWAIRTSLLPYERNAEASKTLNIPLYMLFVLGKELETES